MIHIKSFTFNPFSENSYVLYDETKEAVIIDPGCHNYQERMALKQFIEKEELTVVKLLNTHCHIDHVFGNQFVKDTYNVSLYAHKEDEANLIGSKTVAPMYGFPEFQESSIDVYIDEGQKIQFGNKELDILFTPGHAPGHVVFVSYEHNFVINGDVLFYMSIGRSDLPGGNHAQLINSIKTKLFKLPDNMVVYSGHGDPTSIGFEKANNPFLL